MNEKQDQDYFLDATFMFEGGQKKSQIEFQFDEINIKILCLNESTGQSQSGHYVWPAAEQLCKYLQSEKIINNQQTVIEMGSGVGLCGLLAAHFAKKMIFSDHDPGVLNVIKDNLQIQSKNLKNTSIVDLEWGKQGENQINEIIDQNGLADIILGSDVIYGPDIVEILFYSVTKLLNKTNGVFYMSQSFMYSQETEQIINNECKLHNLQRTVITEQFNENRKGIKIQKYSYCQ